MTACFVRAKKQVLDFEEYIGCQENVKIMLYLQLATCKNGKAKDGKYIKRQDHSRGAAVYKNWSRLTLDPFTSANVEDNLSDMVLFSPAYQCHAFILKWLRICHLTRSSVR